MTTDSRPFAVVTGASTGIDYDDAAGVARAGFAAMMAGQAGTVTGWQNKLQVALARLAPAQIIARLHGKMMEPGSGRAPGERAHEITRSKGGLQ